MRSHDQFGTLSHNRSTRGAGSGRWYRFGGFRSTRGKSLTQDTAVCRSGSNTEALMGSSQSEGCGARKLGKDEGGNSGATSLQDNSDERGPEVTA